MVSVQYDACRLLCTGACCVKIVKINSENGLLSAGDLPGMTVVFLCAFFVITHFFKKGSKMEKIKHNRFSKVLVLLMAVMMVLTMMPNGMGGYHTSLG